MIYTTDVIELSLFEVNLDVESYFEGLKWLKFEEQKYQTHMSTSYIHFNHILHPFIFFYLFQKNYYYFYLFFNISRKDNNFSLNFILSIKYLFFKSF